MAGLEERSGSYRVHFRYHGKQRTLTLGKVSKEEAEAKSAQVDYHAGPPHAATTA
jgi:hypothetical protein